MESKAGCLVTREDRPEKTVSQREGDYLVMQFESSAGPLLPIAVLVLDFEADRLHVRATTAYAGISEDDAEVLRLTTAQLAQQASLGNGSALLGLLEDSLSNSVRLTERVRIWFADLRSELDELCTEYGLTAA
jgi:hypothetical protein